jgi:hypothetical protein
VNISDECVGICRSLRSAVKSVGYQPLYLEIIPRCRLAVHDL